MTVKIKCSYVAEGEPFTLGRPYEIYCADGGVFYIKDDNGHRFQYTREDEYKPAFDGLLQKLNEVWDSHFAECYEPEQGAEQDPEKAIKQEVHELLEKVTELVYNNQELFNIKLDDFITLVKLTEDTK
ncbi:hypothetical protein GMNKNHGO_00127 [Enterococcus phage vB_Efa29212_3e]|uniref:Uncharacterized protein n=1 Tax=Enterococcus phage vB_Efa29212_3e TaxID=2982224 RepID=A0A978CTC9_9CAUD|nr:hypothetical protein GMNKNHGO_00127 [Enterococcus phage vB_Efa29212_3e]